MGWIEIVSLVLNLLLGTGLIVTIATLRSAKMEAAANAKKASAAAAASEIENVESVIKIWREMAQEMAEDRAKLTARVEQLSTEVRRLKNATNKVVRLINSITPENMEETKTIIRKEFGDDEDIKTTANMHDLVGRLQDSSEAGSAGAN